MGEIYRCGAINIAATGFANGKEGFIGTEKRSSKDLISTEKRSSKDLIALRLTRDLIAVSSDKSATMAAKKGDCTLLDLDSWQRGVEDAPLTRRGWVVQERALAPRTVHFGKEELFWECLELTASETFPNGFVEGTSLRQPKIVITPNDFDSDVTENNDEVKSSDSGWCFENKWGDVENYDEIQFKSTPDPLEDTTMLLDVQAWLVEGFWNERFDPRICPPMCFSQLDQFTRGFNLDSAGMRRLRILKRCLKNRPLRGLRINSNVWPPLSCKAMTYRQDQWRVVVETYSGCNLTFEKDKLVAISGIARMMKEDLKCEYLAGMWRKDLEHQLLWKITKPLNTGRRRFPTWSWVSRDTFVQLGHWK
jgi:hypothetical protein